MKTDKKKPLFSRTLQPLVPIHNLAFSGYGFMPDLDSENGYAHFTEASAQSLVNDGVLGRESMMPPTGLTSPPHAGQYKDTGSGGAGSFAGVTAFGAKG
jgi:hypothetical protein